MEETDSDLGSSSSSYPTPAISVRLAPFSLFPPPSSRLHFTRRRTQSPSPPLNYLSLHGLLNISDEPTSSKSILYGLTRDETLAWELFTPHQRLLLLAVLLAVSAAESKKNSTIQHLHKSIDLRDQVLSSMQHKLDDLCQQLNLVKNQSGLESSLEEKFGSEKIKFVDCGCWLCDEHHHQIHHSLPAILDNVAASLVVDVEPEERRMSDMSDWCSSVTSTAEIHFDNLSLDQDLISLRKECQEKDVTIKDLTSFLQSTNKAGSKRETELEEIIRRKKTVIKKLKKDVFVLEEKVMHLTRLRRSSSYSGAISPTARDFPMRLDNLLYDMDVSTTSSSSDSETPPDTPRRALLEDAPVDSVKKEPSALRQIHKSAPVKSSAPSLVVNWKPVSVSSSSSRMRRASSTSDSKKPKRPIHTIARDSSGSHKRWV